jgi:hypothetical protein
MELQFIVSVTVSASIIRVDVKSDVAALVICTHDLLLEPNVTCPWVNQYDQSWSQVMGCNSILTWLVAWEDFSEFKS